MQKVGDYWVPDIDMRRFRNRSKTLANYQGGGHGNQIHHLTQALDHIRAHAGAEAMARATALDVGANVGAYARFLAEVFGHVHAFELAPDTAECLARNVQDWGLSNRIIVHRKGVSEAEAMVGVGGGGWFRRSISREIKGAGTIPVIPIDALGLDDVLLIKLDVEGHEFKALKGARRTLETGRPYVMMELKQRHLDSGKADLTAHNHLLSLGYRIVADLGDPVLDRLYAPAGRD
jgi:FkbM family methyltransferase